MTGEDRYSTTYAVLIPGCAVLETVTLYSALGDGVGPLPMLMGYWGSMVRQTDDKLRSARTLPLCPPGKARTYGTNRRFMPSNTQLTKVCGATLSWRRSMTRMRFSLCFSSRHSPCLPRETMPV